MRATPSDCKLLGDSYTSNQDFIKAILLYQAGEALYEKGVDTNGMINCLQGCALGLKIVVEQLMKVRPDLRPIVASDVVPAMRRVYDQLSVVFCCRTNRLVLIRSLCLQYIETTEMVSEDYRAREATLKEAIVLMETAFKETVSKYSLYNSHLNNLAVLYMDKERPNEAIELFEKAIQSNLKAEDYKNESVRENDLLSCKKGQAKAKEMLKIVEKA